VIIQIDVLAEHVLCHSDSYLAENKGLEEHQARYILVQIKIKNVKREAHRAPIDERKEAQLQSLPLTLDHFRRSRWPNLELLQTVQCRHANNPDVLAASTESTISLS
jgi:hypothetical protein